MTKLLAYMLRLRPSRQRARRGVPIVVAGAGDQDRDALREAGDSEQWDVQFTNSCEEARTLANKGTAPVILCDRDLPETQWREAVRTLSALPHRPIVILVSKVADENLWSEVFRIGGFDILAKPLQAEDARRAVNLALSYWRSETAMALKQSG